MHQVAQFASVFHYVVFLLSQGANRTTEEAERERRERDERMRHSRNPAIRGIPAASGRPRPTQDGAPPTPLTPTSHTGKQSDTYLSGTWNTVRSHLMLLTISQQTHPHRDQSLAWSANGRSACGFIVAPQWTRRPQTWRGDKTPPACLHHRYNADPAHPSLKQSNNEPYYNSNQSVSEWAVFYWLTDKRFYSGRTNSLAPLVLNGCSMNSYFYTHIVLKNKCLIK